MMRWIAVDETGHVPGVAAFLPVGYEVLVDELGQIGDMRSLPSPLPEETFGVSLLSSSVEDVQQPQQQPANKQVNGG